MLDEKQPTSEVVNVGGLIVTTSLSLTEVTAAETYFSESDRAYKETENLLIPSKVNDEVIGSKILPIGELDVANLASKEVTKKNSNQDTRHQKAEKPVTPLEISLAQNTADYGRKKSEIPISEIRDKSNQEKSFSKANQKVREEWKLKLKIEQDAARLKQREASLEELKKTREKELISKAEEDVLYKARQENLRKAQIEKSKLEKSESLKKEAEEKGKLEEEEYLLQKAIEGITKEHEKLLERKKQELLDLNNFLDEISTECEIPRTNLSSATDSLEYSLENSKNILQGFF